MRLLGVEDRLGADALLLEPTAVKRRRQKAFAARLSASRRCASTLLHVAQTRGLCGFGQTSASSFSLTSRMYHAAECDPWPVAPCAKPSPSFHELRTYGRGGAEWAGR